MGARAPASSAVGHIGGTPRSAANRHNPQDWSAAGRRRRPPPPPPAARRRVPPFAAAAWSIVGAASASLARLPAPHGPPPAFVQACRGGCIVSGSVPAGGWWRFPTLRSVLFIRCSPHDRRPSPASLPHPTRCACVFTRACRRRRQASRRVPATTYTAFAPSLDRLSPPPLIVPPSPRCLPPAATIPRLPRSCALVSSALVLFPRSPPSLPLPPPLPPPLPILCPILRTLNRFVRRALFRSGFSP